MIEVPGGIGETSANVCRFKVGKVVQDFRFGCATGEHIEHIHNPNAHPANTGTPATLLWIDGNTFHAD